MISPIQDYKKDKKAYIQAGKVLQNTTPATSGYLGAVIVLVEKSTFKVDLEAVSKKSPAYEAQSTGSAIDRFPTEEPPKRKK